MDPDRHFERQVIYLAQLERGHFPITLTGYRFVDCEVLGPAVVFPISGLEMIGCDLGGTALGVLWEIPTQRTEIIGAIGLVDCSFIECRFKGVGIAGHPQMIWQMINGTTEVPPPA